MTVACHQGFQNKKIQDGFEAAGLPMPKVENFCGGVKVTFQRKNVNIVKPNSAYTQDVAVNTKYLSEKLNVNRKTIQRDIAYLQEIKLIQWVGSDKTGHWEVIDDKDS